MTLYNCPDCRRWHAGSGHVCGDPLPEIRNQRSLESAVVNAARALCRNRWLFEDTHESDFVALEQALLELDGLDRPLA